MTAATGGFYCRSALAAIPTRSGSAGRSDLASACRTCRRVSALTRTPGYKERGIAFSQSGEGAGRELGLEAEVKGVEYEWLGACGTKGEARSDRVLSGTTTLGAEDEAGKPTGAWLGGEP